MFGRISFSACSVVLILCALLATPVSAAGSPYPIGGGFPLAYNEVLTPCSYGAACFADVEGFSNSLGALSNGYFDMDMYMSGGCSFLDATLSYGEYDSLDGTAGLSYRVAGFACRDSNRNYVQTAYLTLTMEGGYGIFANIAGTLTVIVNGTATGGKYSTAGGSALISGQLNSGNGKVCLPPRLPRGAHIPVTNIFSSFCH